ncbi:hypothetical protein WICMUC_001945 [Wickerhamomyces mucosus]|uniref:Zn(2)-C6 fungal-type domain-containing protein n=1 Tax=Wickerhamomyces mucosus TaxID=1378264 RepID=A0A9P8PTJ0_9ASCO|nr:hypothetical protein WICMUC_001945 [Wickerhamomyces mucosus]
MVSPVSCNFCRKRKIRCSRDEHGCSNCLKRDIKCCYPSKFRSLDIKNISENDSKPILLNNSSNSDSNNIQINESTDSIKADYEHRIEELEKKLGISQDLLSIINSNGCDISKYFGEDSLVHLEYSMMSEALKFDHGKLSGQNINLRKKKLPIFIEDNSVLNFKFIGILIDKFFNKDDQFNFFNEIFDYNEIVGFLSNYNDIIDWNHDEIFSTLLAILIDVFKTFLNQDDDDDGNINKLYYGFSSLYPLVKDHNKILKNLVNYYIQITYIKPTESISYIKTQLIMVNYFYYIYRFESCWKTLYQLISDAYSLGIHIIQGPIWIKINLMESLICSISTRPNCINEGLIKSNHIEDEFKEIQFANILRAKNKIYIESYINNYKVQFADFFYIDLRFHQYTKILKDKIEQINISQNNCKILSSNIEQKIKIDKCNLLLALNYSSHMKLYIDFHETEDIIDSRLLKLFTDFLKILESSVYGKLYLLRNIFASLECLVYQFLLIFLKYLNHKTVSLILENKDNFKSDKIEILNQQLTTLKSYQDRILRLFKSSSNYSNIRVLKVVQIISNVNISDIKTFNLVPGDSQESFKDNFEYDDHNNNNFSMTNPIEYQEAKLKSNNIQLTPNSIIDDDNFKYNESNESITNSIFNNSDNNNNNNNNDNKSNLIENLNSTTKYYANNEIKDILQDHSIMCVLHDVSEVSDYMDTTNFI